MKESTRTLKVATTYEENKKKKVSIYTREEGKGGSTDIHHWLICRASKAASVCIRIETLLTGATASHVSQ